MVILLALYTTWKFVRINPLLSQTNPVPLPEGISMTLSENLWRFSWVLVTKTTEGPALLKTAMLLLSSLVRKGDIGAVIAEFFISGFPENVSSVPDWVSVVAIFVKKMASTPIPITAIQTRILFVMVGLIPAYRRVSISLSSWGRYSINSVCRSDKFIQWINVIWTQWSDSLF